MELLRMNVTKIGVQDIDASLKYGQVFSGKIWGSAVILLSIASACIGIVVIIIPITSIEYRSDIIFIVCGSFLFIFLVLSTVIIQMFFNKGKKKAALWLKDAVILDAQAKSLGQTLHVRNLIMRTATAIEVSFEYDDKRYVRQSIYKDKPLYLAVYTKYVDKKILIAYSPKYDEVMLIKPQSAQRIKDSNNNTK